MSEIINPYKEFVAEITPNDFEKYCLEILKSYAEKEKLQQFEIVHNTKIESSDGIYQIDVYAEFVALGVNFKVIAECKRYSTPVNREKVVLLTDKIRSLGAQKGILISTSGFQSGAVKYAKEHGIALIQIFSKSVRFFQMSASREIDEAYLMFQQLYPRYYACEYDEYGFPMQEVYPSKEQLREIHSAIKDKLL